VGAQADELDDAGDGVLVDLGAGWGGHG
jgi:hypothetical protein